MSEKVETRCKCGDEERKPVSFPDSPILWCDHCGKIVYISLRREPIIDMSSS